MIRTALEKKFFLVNFFFGFQPRVLSRVLLVQKEGQFVVGFFQSPFFFGLVDLFHSVVSGQK